MYCNVLFLARLIAVEQHAAVLDRCLMLLHGVASARVEQLVVTQLLHSTNAYARASQHVFMHSTLCTCIH
jgi:hypothetical protein